MFFKLDTSNIHQSKRLTVVMILVSRGEVFSVQNQCSLRVLGGVLGMVQMLGSGMTHRFPRGVG